MIMSLLLTLSWSPVYGFIPKCANLQFAKEKEHVGKMFPKV